jgi:hypothetical protein
MFAANIRLSALLLMLASVLLALGSSSSTCLVEGYSRGDIIPSLVTFQAGSRRYAPAELYSSQMPRFGKGSQATLERPPVAGGASNVRAKVQMSYGSEQLSTSFITLHAGDEQASRSRGSSKIREESQGISDSDEDDDIGGDVLVRMNVHFTYSDGVIRSARVSGEYDKGENAKAAGE